MSEQPEITEQINMLLSRVEENKEFIDTIKVKQEDLQTQSDLMKSIHLDLQGLRATLPKERLLVISVLAVLDIVAIPLWTYFINPLLDRFF